MARDHLLIPLIGVAACSPPGGAPPETIESSSTSSSGDTSESLSWPPTTGKSTTTSASATTGGSSATTEESTTGTSKASTEMPTSSTSEGSGGETGELLGCGDRVLQGDETCDDGNQLDFDGCDAHCQTEAPALRLCAGDEQTCVADPLGRVKCWGVNLDGQLGLGDTEHRGDDPGEMGANLPEVDLGMKVKQLACGRITCALGTEGLVKCWGTPGSSLGIGSTENIGDSLAEMGAALPAVDLGEPATGIEVAFTGACAYLESGAIKCWGYNSYGQLGLGDAEKRGDAPGEMGAALPPLDLGAMKPVQVSASGTWTCGRDFAGEVKCWGEWIYLGLPIPDANNRGDDPGEMGDTLPFVDLGTGVKVASVTASAFDTCIVSQDGQLKCWGENGSNILWPFAEPLEYYGWQPGQMGDSLPFFDLGNTRVLAVAVGYHSICLLLQDRSVKCWGNKWGLMGQGNDQPWLGKPLSGVPPIDFGAGEVVRQLSMTHTHACVVLAGERVKCWGDNSAGALGYGDTNDRGDGPNEMGDFLPYVEIF